MNFSSRRFLIRSFLGKTIQNEVELIIMGSHGRTSLKELLIGSTTERVIGHAPCPVLVAKS
jgi:nucleotide-binding universal stress UspA family protein